MRRAAVLVVLIACGTSSSETPGAGGDGGATNDGGTAAASPCPATRAYVERCAGDAGDLNCGSNFEAWCAQNDTSVNSDAFRRAEAKCLPEVACVAGDRNDCEYKSYMGETPTTAQKALVEAYCKTCEPNDVAGCQTRSITYDPNGKGEVNDVFIAAWELNDTLCDQIREKCTGSALDAGTDPCDKAFGSCAAGPYLDAVPDCPK